MAVDERSRHELYRRLEEVLGSDAATTLIEHLPPVGWADVATRHDLASLEERIELRFARIDDRFDRIEERFTAIDGRFTAIDERFETRINAMGDRLTAAFEHELRAQFSTTVFGLVSIVLTMAALAFALVRFT